MADTFDSLRPRIVDYLHERGINPRKRFRCLNPAHLDRDPSMGFDPKRNKVHCFACGADYDLFDLLTIDENLSSPLEALTLASKRYGDSSSHTPLSSHLPAGKRSDRSVARPLPTGPAPLGSGADRPARRAVPESGGSRGEGGSAPIVSGEETVSPAYLDICFAHRAETSYFYQRGLSMDTVDRFRLGYDPRLGCVVLPCEGGRCVRRSVGEKRYLNEKGQPSPLFQPELLLSHSPLGSGSAAGETSARSLAPRLPTANAYSQGARRICKAAEPPTAAQPLVCGGSPVSAGETPVFLLEGAFDALSAEELGHRACALNGSGNREKAAALLRRLPKPAPILILTDNDTAGEAWARALTDEFPWLYRCPPVPQGKDLNEYLCADREGAARFLSQCVADWAASQPPPYTESSAAGQMEAFLAYIEKQASRPALKTGFPKLDEALDGGLYDGLYVIGAVSSLGKTAFCMQMADQLAMEGRDVLIFSLEMMTWELMARSISRESFQLDTSARRRMAKTARGVLDGKRWANYTAQETAHLELARTKYASYAGRLYFREGDHETGLDYIQKEVARHIAETGVKPVVLIDYLQIIAPVDVHFTDKQNLDRVVCALKKLSRQYELTIFAISSFNRENYNLEVSMNAFKESGGIDYSADVLLGLQARGAGKPGFNIDEEKRKDPRELELKILKNRSAALGAPIPLRYYPAFSCFEEG